jgi:hypothetical protein
MKFIPIILIAGLVFLICWLVDKGFTKLFRGQTQHMSGLSIRPNKRYGSMGIIIGMLGVAGILAGITDGNAAVIVGGGILVLAGIGLAIYYVSTGIFYDEDTFLYSNFGKKTRTYRYNQIRHQQLYTVQGGSIIVELHMSDGTAVLVQSNMVGYDKFLDTAFLGWVRQKNIDVRTGCAYHDPSKGCWFPSQEDL